MMNLIKHLKKVKILLINPCRKSFGRLGRDWNAHVWSLKAGPTSARESGCIINATFCFEVAHCRPLRRAPFGALQCPMSQMDTYSPLVPPMIHSSAIAFPAEPPEVGLFVLLGQLEKDCLTTLT